MMKRFSKTTLALWVCVTLTPATASWADRIVDNFESYSEGRIIGPTATSIPWRRFGGATNDNVVATSDERWALKGTGSALYGLVWPGSFGAVRYVFGKETDLSEHRSVTVIMRSDRSDTHTRVRLAISNGHTTFVAVQDHPVARQTQQITFRLGPDHMGRSTGEDNYEDVIRGAWNIGFDFRNAETEGYETIVFDDFVLTGSGGGPKVSALD